jgi:nucleotide-binding universal stress UspA family protein
MEDKTIAQLKELAKKESDAHGVEIDTIIKKGKIYDKINKAAKDLDATLILMGTSGSMGLMKFIGSNTLRVIRESKVPVISIKGSHIDHGLTNILLPLDLTKETKEKVAKAVWLSKLYNGATINMVSFSTSKDGYIMANIKKQEKFVRKFLTDKGVKFTSEIISDMGGNSLPENVFKYAQKMKSGLIMIMTQQENEITDMFIGSAAQAIINGSEIPVMSVVPAPKKNAPSNIGSW